MGYSGAETGTDTIMTSGEFPKDEHMVPTHAETVAPPLALVADQDAASGKAAAPAEVVSDRQSTPEGEAVADQAKQEPLKSKSRKSSDSGSDSKAAQGGGVRLTEAPHTRQCCG